MYFRKCKETVFFRQNYTFSAASTCFLVALSEAAARLKDILEVGAVKEDKAGMKILSIAVCVWSLLSPEPRPAALGDLPIAFYQRERTSRVAFPSLKCEKNLPREESFRADGKGGMEEVF